MYTTLPVQTIHADYLSPHVLLESNRVVGVLDFEFATKDLRLWDYICGLDHFALFPWQEKTQWQLVQAFSAGYSEQVSLTRQEAEALTLAWRLQRASSIVYWTGWLREGKVTHQSVVKAVTETLLLEDWFEDNATKLLNESNLA
ncbi:MAG: phosphotransferase [Cyanobacteria bacterium CAN_BIN43]|nr:phosphotransferase [Cyanobacteria bacterium CAN_BIN43]